MRYPAINISSAHLEVMYNSALARVLPFNGQSMWPRYCSGVNRSLSCLKKTGAELRAKSESLKAISLAIQRIRCGMTTHTAIFGWNDPLCSPTLRTTEALKSGGLVHALNREILAWNFFLPLQSRPRQRQTSKPGGPWCIFDLPIL